MTNSSNPLVDVYGKTAPDAAKFGKGAQSLERIKEATDARRAPSDASAPRKYGER